MEKVILINKYDKKIGTMNKFEAHKKGILHRAISVFLFNQNKEMLLQQRNKNKYHSPLLWSNACCSHPQPKESYKSAAKRRLFQELRINVKLNAKFKIIYKAYVGNNFIEHEIDYIFFGFYNNKIINFNKKEINNIIWMSKKKLKTKLQEKPEVFTKWFKFILNHYYQYFQFLL